MARHFFICTLQEAPATVTARFERKETTVKTLLAAGLSADTPHLYVAAEIIRNLERRQA